MKTAKELALMAARALSDKKGRETPRCWRSAT